MTKDELTMIKHSRVIVDPFPEQSLWEIFHKPSLFNRIYAILFHPKDIPQKISIWAAYKRGYDKAYEEIRAECE